jgi:hypothetical protein
MMTTLASTTLALALNAGPILEKVYYPGFTHPDYRFSKTCRLYPDRLEVIQNLAGSMVTETRGQIDASQLAPLLSNAVIEAINNEDNNLCDGPRTTIKGRSPDASGDASFLLFTSGGCGSPRQTRSGGAAWLLIQLIDSWCPTDDGPE